MGQLDGAWREDDFERILRAYLALDDREGVRAALTNLGHLNPDRAEALVNELGLRSVLDRHDGKES